MDMWWNILLCIQIGREKRASGKSKHERDWKSRWSQSRQFPGDQYQTKHRIAQVDWISIASIMTIDGTASTLFGHAGFQRRHLNVTVAVFIPLAGPITEAYKPITSWIQHKPLMAQRKEDVRDIKFKRRGHEAMEQNWNTTLFMSVGAEPNDPPVCWRAGKEAIAFSKQL